MELSAGSAMEGWEDTSADEADEVIVPAAAGSDRSGGRARAKPAKGGQRADADAVEARAAGNTAGKAATANRLNMLHSSHVERNRKLEQRKAELERQKLEAEEASMVQWNAKKTPSKVKRVSAKKSRPRESGTDKLPTAAVQEQSRQPDVTTGRSAVSASISTSAVDNGDAQRPGFALPDVTPAEFEVFVEAVRGYQGLPTPVNSQPASGVTVITPAKSVVPACDNGDNSPSLDELSTHGKAASDEVQQITITELPGPVELLQQQQRQQRQQRQRPEARTNTKPAEASSKALVADPYKSAKRGHPRPTAPPSPGSMSDISRAVADAREADNEGDRRTAWMLHTEAVRVYQSAARRCSGGIESWPPELRAEEAQVVARTAVLEREVKQQARGERPRTERKRGSGLFACCGSKKTAGTDSPSRSARAAGTAAAVDGATAAAQITPAVVTDSQTSRPASDQADGTGLQAGIRGEGNSRSSSRTADGRSRSPPGGVGNSGRGGRREYSPHGAEYGPSQSRSPVSTKATTTQREIQNLHDGLPTKPTSSGAIKITVKTLTAGESYTVRIGQTASVDALKASVETIEGTEAALQRLAIMTSDGSTTRQLTQGSALLSDYDLQDGATLLLVKRLRHASLSTSSDSSTPTQEVSNRDARWSSVPGDEHVTTSDGGSPDRLSVASSGGSESRIPVHRGTPPRNGKSANRSDQSSGAAMEHPTEIGRQQDHGSSDDVEDEKENARDTRVTSVGEEGEGAGAGAEAGGTKKKAAAAAAQAERLRRLAEPVRPRGLELNVQASSSEASAEEEKVKKKKKTKSSAVRREAVLAGAATPKGAATKTTAELKREKADAEAAEQEARRKAEAWKRKRAREAARKAATQARADAIRSGTHDPDHPDGCSEAGEQPKIRPGTGRQMSTSDDRSDSMANVRREASVTLEEQLPRRARAGTRSSEKESLGSGRKAAVNQRERKLKKVEQREDDDENNGGVVRTASPGRLQSAPSGNYSVDTDEVSIDLESDDDTRTSSNSRYRSTPQRKLSHTDSGHSRSYLSSTSDSYSEDSDEDYVHSVRSTAPAQCSTAPATVGGSGTSRLSLVAPPATAVRPRPILSSMSLGFPGGAGETTKGNVLFSTARFGARAADVSGVDAVLCDPEHAAGEELLNAEELQGCIAVARRGESSFVSKARRVQAAGALALFGTR